MKRKFTSFLLLAASIGTTCFAALSDYVKPDASHNHRSNPTARLVHNFALEGATKDGVASPFSVKLNEKWSSQNEVYVDKTTEVADISAGDHITVTLQHDVIWMHGYLYIDYDNDGVFNEDNELVSYSFYSAEDAKFGLNSEGQYVQDGVNIDIPAFTVPEDVKSVTTRMRFKVDWNSKNPAGSTKQSIGQNNGSIFDFTVNVHGKAEKCMVTVEQPEGAVLTLTDAQGAEVASSTEVDKGTQLTIGSTLEDVAYQLDAYTVNGVEQAENTFTVQEATTVSAQVSIKSYTLEVQQPENGKVEVVKVDELNGQETPVASGEKVAYYDQLTVKTIPAEGYQLKSVLVNGKEVAEPTILVEESQATEGAIRVSAVFEPVPVVEPVYQGPSAQDDVRNRDDRRLKNIKIDGATLNGTAQAFDFELKNHPSQPKVYMDESSTILEATAGDKMNVSWDFRTNTEWTHYYLYIDYNHDGVFNEDNELVSFTYYSATDGDGENSLGQFIPESQRGKAMKNLPEFQIPESVGNVKTRMRFKADWNSKNPLGNPTQSIGKNGGTMVDFTINIHAKEVIAPVKYAVTLKEAVNGTYKVLNAEGQEVTNGQEVEEGAKLTVEATPAEGYKVKEILVNNKPVQAGEKFTVQEATTIEVIFEADVQQCTVTFSATEGGSIVVLDGNGAEMTSGQQVAEGTVLYGCKINEDKGYLLTSLTVNEVEMIDKIMRNPFTGQILLEMPEPVKSNVNIVATFTPQGEIAKQYTVTLKSSLHGTYTVTTVDGQEITDGQKVKENTELQITATPDEGYLLEQILVNGKELPEGTTYVVNGETSIEVYFYKEYKRKWTVNIEQNEGGTVVVTDQKGWPLESGALVEDGSILECSITEDAGYKLTSILVNDQEMISQVQRNPYVNMVILEITEPVKSDVRIKAVFTSSETGISDVTLAEAGFDAAAQQLNVPAGASVAVYNAAGQQVMSAQGAQQLSTANLAHGIYVARVVSEGAVKVIKFMKK